MTTEAERKGLEAIAESCYLAHSSKCNIWQHGNIKECWFDEDGNVCVKYEDGAWWHYKCDGTEWKWW